MLYVQGFWGMISLVGWLGVPFAAWRHSHVMKRQRGRWTTPAGEQ